jgi:hypothetical protein
MYALGRIVPLQFAVRSLPDIAVPATFQTLADNPAWIQNGVFT